MSYIKSLQGLTGKLTAAHGTSVIVTAEPAEKMPAMRAATGYTGEAIVDPTHLLAMELRRRGLLDVAISPRGGYEHDMAQPAVLVLQKDGTVLYDWAIVPSLVRCIADLECGMKHVADGCIVDESGRRQGQTGVEGGLGQCRCTNSRSAAGARKIFSADRLAYYMGEGLWLIVFAGMVVWITSAL